MQLYTNGTIITMVKEQTAEAVLTDQGKIAAVGKMSDMLAICPDAELIDLGGATMMPAFIDAHSHFSSYAASFLQAALEECVSFAEIGREIQDFLQSNRIKPGEWMLAKGYDHNFLEEKAHPSLALLDYYAPENPLVLQHASGHVGVFNTLALEKLGLTPQTPSPEGGRIEQRDGRLTGYMEENAFFFYLKQVPMSGMETMLEAYKKAQRSYASHGICTIQEGMTVKEMLPLYRYMLSQNMLYLDVVAYAALTDAKAIFEEFPEAVKKYSGHFKLGGCKLFLDGSPQGRTAWMRTPYLGDDPDYCGYGTMKDEELYSAALAAAREGIQLLAHCNGDAAAQQYLDALERVSREADVSAIRPVMIHAQLLDRDQLPAVKQLGVIPSFFVAHVCHWGDVHIKNFGLNRASRISPTMSALKNDILFTFHQDSPVIEPDMLESVWCAVNRQTKAGVPLGYGERISVYEALKAVTINAAYQYFEEDTKGSIAPGKNADFVILDKNPLAADPMSLRDIKVLKTIHLGELIYER